MAAERPETEPSHELRLEGIGLILGGGLLLAAIVGAFFLGRWVERRSRPPVPLEAGSGGPLAQMVDTAPAVDATDGMDYFDTLEGKQKQAEPDREMPSAGPETERAKSTSPADPAARLEPVAELETAEDTAGNGDDPFYVQVMALRDQRAAASMLERLQREGYRVRLFTEREGGGTLYKVRVGGYPAETEARTVALKLRESGYPGAFVRLED